MTPLSRWAPLFAAALLGCTPPTPLATSEPTAAPRPEPATPAAPATPEPLGAPGSVLAQQATPHHDVRFHDHFQEALIVAEQGDLSGRIDRLRLALFDAPGSAATWFELGQAYLEAGRRGQAVDCIREAAVREPRHLDAQRFLARHHLDRGEPERARAHVQALTRYARDDFRSAWLQSRTFVGLSMWEESITAARRAIALNPEFVYAYNTLGFAALQVGRDELALQYLEAARELEPVEPYMLNNLGIAYERLDRPEDALTAFSEAAALDPGYVKAVGNRERVQVVVDERLADAVADILRRRAGEAPVEGVASAEGPTESRSGSGILSP